MAGAYRRAGGGAKDVASRHLGGPWVRSAIRCAFGRQAGFTLLEVLVVLVVLGFLMIGLTQGVRAGLALWDAQSRRVGETAELDAAARTLRRLLSGIAPSPSAGFATGATSDAELKGTAESMTFVGDLPTGLGTTRRADITLDLRQARLILRWTPHRHEITNAPAPQPVETELLRGIDRLDFAYWGSPSPEQAAGWQTQWDGPSVPELVRLRLVFAKNDRRRFPDLIAAPKL
jgi:general secretion pathway protein J